MQAIAIIQAIMAGVAAAPKVAELAISAKEYINAMFKAGLITKEIQDAANAYNDAVCGAAKLGIVPPSFQVQPDPTE